MYVYTLKNIFMQLNYTSSTIFGCNNKKGNVYVKYLKYLKKWYIKIDDFVISFLSTIFFDRASTCIRVYIC